MNDEIRVVDADGADAPHAEHSLAEVLEALERTRARLARMLSEDDGAPASSAPRFSGLFSVPDVGTRSD